MTELIHTHSMTLDSTPGRVFDALTDPEDLKVWFAEHVDVE
ncbi:MAG TPA: ATPase, partial [Alphaproteobacteria bacterium]|nr:ATPase [Alphaproteobacteria bacterium]